MDWESAILQGFATGVGVIFAQKFVRFMDRHPMTKKIKKVVEVLTNTTNDKEDES